MEQLPDEDSIQNVVDYTSISRQEAITLLKKYNYDFSKAITEYFENPVNALQPLQPQNTWQDADTLPYPEDTLAPNGGAGQSRPPSRASFGGETYRAEPLIDLSREHAAADPNKVLTLEEQEYQQIQTAMALSRGEQLPGQENGVTGASQHFGPANNNEYYDNKKWALTTVPTNATIQEIVENPPPAQRHRKLDEPAFLRPSLHLGYLSSLLTILHSIPLSREALLLPSFQCPSYGHDPHWWSGTPIVGPKVVSFDDPHNSPKDLDDLLQETQRLMAFLDNTNRAYGSVDPLADSDFFRNYDAESDFTRFFESWVGAAVQACPDDQLTQVFTSIARNRPRPNAGDPDAKEFYCLEPLIEPLPGQNLYDILDKIVWPDSGFPRLDEVWIEHVGDIFTMHLYDPARKQEGLDVKVPAVWYPDRYLDAFKQLSWDMRLRKGELADDIKRLETLQRRCSIYQGLDGRNVDVRSTLLAAAEAAEVAVKNQGLTNGILEGLQPLALEQTRVSSSEGTECANELREMVDRIDKKVQLLEQRRQELLEARKAVSEEMTKPSASPSEPPFHKYTLRGISTRPHITYVLRPARRDALRSVEEARAENAENSAWQWWRISFSRDDVRPTQPLQTAGPPTESEAEAAATSTISASGPYSDWSRKISQKTHESSDVAGYSIRKVHEYEVLKAAREEGNSVLLVYANEKATTFSGSSLKPALIEFVARDKQAFEEELQMEQDEESGVRVDDSESTGQVAQSPLHPMEDISLNGGSDDTPQMSPESETEKHPSAMRSIDESHNPYKLILDEPPPYGDGGGRSKGQEMQERGHGPGLTLSSVRPSRIGQHAERMMARIGEEEALSEEISSRFGNTVE